jgi:hypothetical protein
MPRRRRLAVTVEHSYPQEVQLQEHQQARSESAPKLVSPVTWHEALFYRKFGQGGTKSLISMARPAPSSVRGW